MGVGAEPLPSPRAGAQLAPLGSIPGVPAASASEPDRQQEPVRYSLVSLLIVGHALGAVNEDGELGKAGLSARAPAFRALLAGAVLWIPRLLSSLKNGASDDIEWHPLRLLAVDASHNDVAAGTSQR